MGRLFRMVAKRILRNNEFLYKKALPLESSQKALLFAGQLVPNHVKRCVGWLVGWLVTHLFVCKSADLLTKAELNCFFTIFVKKKTINWRQIQL